jgi:hypothetical protein
MIPMHHGHSMYSIVSVFEISGGKVEGVNQNRKDRLTLAAVGASDKVLDYVQYTYE